MKRSRILSFLLVLCLLVTMVPGLALSGAAATEKSVSRLYGQTRYETAFQLADCLKAAMGVDKFNNIIVASGTSFADALGGSYLASVKEAPIVLVQDNNTESVKQYIRGNLQPGGTVYLLGGTAAVPASMETGLEGFAVKRLGGADRYETNLSILYEAGVSTERIIVCTGKNYADSLSASALGLPILLVKDTVTDAQKDFLRTTYNDKYVIGGYNAVSEAAEDGLSVTAAWSGCEVYRISGSNRYETSVLVAQWFFDNPQDIYMAYGKNFPDGLCAGPLACYAKSPLILSANGQENPARAYVKQQNVQNAIVIGGSGLISDKSALKTVEDYAYANDSNLLPDMSAFLNREPDGGNSSPVYFKKIPDNLGDTVAAEMLALLQQDKYQLELIGVRTSDNGSMEYTKYDFLYVGNAEGIALRSNAYEEKIFHVELEVRDRKAEDEPTDILYKFSDGFTLEDPGSRVSVSLSGPKEESNNSSSSGERDCLFCGGSGRCSTCGGSGTVRKWVAGTTHDYVTQDCTSCVSGSCRSCSGSGKA